MAKSAARRGKAANKEQPAASHRRMETSPLPPASFRWTAGALFAGLALLRLAADRFPEARLWGLSFPGYLPSWMELLIAFFGLLLASPALYGLFRWKADFLTRMPPFLVSILAAAGGGTLFWLLRMDTFFLGDGASYLAEHFRWVRGLSISEDVLFSPGSAPLTAWILAKGAVLFFDTAHAGAITAQPQFIFQLTAIVAGAVFLFVVTYSSLRRDEDTSLRIGRIVLLAATPGFLFFFGYVEYYTLYFTALAAFFIASVACAEGRLSPVWMIAAFILSAALHIMTLVTLPGLALALASRGGEPLRGLVRTRTLLAGAAAALLLGGVYYFASGISSEGSRTILALQPFGEEGAVQHYTLLSAAHLGDVLNMLLLAAGPALLLLVLLRRRGTALRPQDVVALSHVLFTGFLLFFGYTCFGMARDWDVNAGFGVAVSLLAITLLTRQEESPARSYLAYLASGAAIVAVLPWLAVNIDSGMSEHRFRDIMALDDRNVTGDFALNGYEHLRKHYQRNGDTEREAWAIMKKVEMVGYPGDFRKLLRSVTMNVPAADQQRYMDFVFDALNEKFREMSRRGSDSLYAGTKNEYAEVAVEALLQLPQLRGFANRQDAYFDMQMQRLSELLPGHPLLIMVREDYRYERGGEYHDPAPFINALPYIRSSSLIASRAGRALIMTDRRPEAAMVLQRAMEIDTTFSLPHFLLGYIAATDNPPRPADAISHFESFIAHPEGHQLGDDAAGQRLIGQARDMISRMMNLQQQSSRSRSGG